MLNINHESILNELNLIQKQLEKATPESSVNMLQLLSNSLKIINIEERTNDISDEEWNDYCYKRYELGSIMIKLIKCYSNRLDDYITSNLNKNKSSDTNSTLVDSSDSIKTTEEPIVKKVSLKDDNISRSPSSTLSKSDSITLVNRNSTKISPIRQQSISQSISKQKSVNKGKGAASDDASSIYSYTSNSDRSNVVTLRKGSTLKNSINIDGTETHYDDHETKYVPSNVYSEDESNNKPEHKENATPLTPNSEAARSRVNSFNSINKVGSIRSSPSLSSNRNSHYNPRISYSNSVNRNSMDSLNNVLLNDASNMMSSSPNTMMMSNYNNGYMGQMPTTTAPNNYYYDINQMAEELQNQIQTQNFYNNMGNGNNNNYYMDQNGNPTDQMYDQQQQNLLQERFNMLSQENQQYPTYYNNSEVSSINGLSPHIYSQIPAIEDPEQYQSSEGTIEDTLDNNTKDNFIGNYICIKNYQAEDDAYIDLEAGDIVSISEFSGVYALGFNCRTERYGLFPIYDIDSLNGFAIFYRVLEDNGSEASKNDAIFVVSEAENDLLLGYNITKGDTGFFTMDQLEVLQFDSNNNPIFEDTPPPPSTTVSMINDMNSLAMNNMIATTDPQMQYLTYAANGQGGLSYNYYPFNSYDTNNGSFNTMSFMNSADLSSSNYSLIQDPVAECGNILNDLSVVEEPEDQEPITEENADQAGATPTPSTIAAKKTRHKKVTETDHRNIKGAINHCIEKETEFNEKMKASIDLLINPLEKWVDTNDEILNKVEIGIFFKYFPKLYQFSNDLLASLKESLALYDTQGLSNICKIFNKDSFHCSSFIKYSENYEYSLDAYDRIKKDFLKFDRVEDILRTHKKEFHRLYFKDLLYTPINHFVTYRLFLEEIQKKVFEDDIYDTLEEEIEYLKKIGNQMNYKVGESIQIRKFFDLKKIVMGFPADFISYTQRKLISDFEIMGNVRGTFRKHVYIFNDCLMVVSTNKEAKKKGFQYVLEKIMNFRDYDFEKVEQASKICIKCVCQNSQLLNDSYDSRLKPGKRNGLFRTSKGRKPTYDDNSMYLYFDNPATFTVFFEECKKQKSRIEKGKGTNSTTSSKAATTSSSH